MTKTAYGLNLSVIAFFALNGLYFGYNGNDDMVMVFLIPTIILLSILPACSMKE
jgi:hypothetical protein